MKLYTFDTSKKMYRKKGVPFDNFLHWWNRQSLGNNKGGRDHEKKKTLKLFLCDLRFNHHKVISPKILLRLIQLIPDKVGWRSASS